MLYKRFLASAIGLCALLIAAGPSLSANRALIIGIADYPIQPLKGPLTDAENATRLAREIWGFSDSEILTLLNQEATRANIRNALQDWLVAQTNPGDKVFFYFSGHGHYQPDQNNDEADGRDETIVPIDVTYSDGRFHGMIVDDELDVFMGKLADREAFFIFDSCHSGTVTRSHLQDSEYTVDGYSIVKQLDPTQWRLTTRSAPIGSPPPPVSPASNLGSAPPEAPFANSNSVEVWSAVLAHQQAFTDLISGRGSIFTNSLTKGLLDWKADANQDGRISRTELMQFLRRDSQSFCDGIEQCKAGLTPALEIRKNLTFPASGRINPSDTFQPVVHSSPIRLNLEPERPIRVGEPMRISLITERDGYLFLLDKDAAGNLRQIYPNNQLADCRNHPLRAGEPLIIPNHKADPLTVVAEPPLGEGTLAAIIIHNESALSSLECRYNDLEVIGQLDQRSTELDNLVQLWIGEDTGYIEWSAALLGYEIISP